MPTSYRDDVLAHKYAEIPEENKAKSHKKKPHPKKAKHKHVYENALIETEKDSYSFSSSPDGYFYRLVSYCPVCGKVGDWVEDELTKKFVPKRYVLSFGCISCPLMGSVKTYNEFIDEAKKTYKVFHLESFNFFKQKFLEI